MKLFKSNYLLIMAVVFLAACSGKSEKADNAGANEPDEASAAGVTEERQVNTESSVVHWKGEMLGLYSHEGNISLSEGSLTLTDGKVAGGSFTVDMSTITPTDKNYNEAEGNTPEKLVGHLSSPDFFDIANYPSAVFTINSAEGNSASGTLTLRGKIGEETIENMTYNEDGSISGTLTFNRKNYDVMFDHPLQEMVLSNDVKLDIMLHLGE